MPKFRVKAKTAVMLVVLMMLAGVYGQTDAADFYIEKALWKVDTKSLEVSGNGTPKAPVSLWDADSGRYIGSVTVSMDGRWRMRMANPTSVPCRIEAGSNQNLTRKSVKDAPGVCKTMPALTDSDRLRRG